MADKPKLETIDDIWAQVRASLTEDADSAAIEIARWGALHGVAGVLGAIAQNVPSVMTHPYMRGLVSQIRTFDPKKH